jgi:hypothetical protein
MSLLFKRQQTSKGAQTLEFDDTISDACGVGAWFCSRTAIGNMQRRSYPTLAGYGRFGRHSGRCFAIWPIICSLLPFVPVTGALSAKS